MIDIFYKESFYISWFISVMSIKCHIENCNREIETNYTDICNDFRNYYSNATNLKICKKIRNSIFELYEKLHITDFHNYEFNSKKSSLLKWIPDLDNKNLKEYIISELNCYTLPQTNILNTIKHIEETLNNAKTNYYAIIAAVIGALSAIAATIIVG